MSVTFLGTFFESKTEYLNNSHTLDELEQRIQGAVTSIENSELKVVSVVSRD
jgi:hypothetical protein